MGEELPQRGGVLVGASINKKVRKKVQPQEEILGEQKEGTQPGKLDLNVC